MIFKEVSCPHCSESKGTCKNDNKKSCGTCLKSAKLENKSEIVRCGVCEGTGVANIREQKLQIFIPVVIIGIVLSVFYVYCLSSLRNEFRNEVFTSVVSLTSVIVTFYFTRKK